MPEAPLLPHPSPGPGSQTACIECRGHQKNLDPDSARWSRAILINSTSADDQLVFANARRVTLGKLAQTPCPGDAMLLAPRLLDDHTRAASTAVSTHRRSVEASLALPRPLSIFYVSAESWALECSTACKRHWRLGKRSAFCTKPSWVFCCLPHSHPHDILPQAQCSLLSHPVPCTANQHPDSLLNKYPHFLDTTPFLL